MGTHQVDGLYYENLLKKFIHPAVGGEKRRNGKEEPDERQDEHNDRDDDDRKKILACLFCGDIHRVNFSFELGKFRAQFSIFHIKIVYQESLPSPAYTRAK